MKVKIRLRFSVTKPATVSCHTAIEIEKQQHIVLHNLPCSAYSATSAACHTTPYCLHDDLVVAITL